MNNKELIELFTTIRDKAENCLDLAIELKRARKAYLKSEFYRETRMSIDEAYKLYCMDALHGLIKFISRRSILEALKGNTDLLRDELEIFFDNLDYHALDGMFAYLEEKLSEIDLTSLQGDLSEMMQEFKSSIILTGKK